MKQFFIAATILLLTACSQTPDWDYDRSANFDQFKHFSWAENATLATDKEHYQVSPLMEKRVRGAIVAALKSKGMSQTDATAADVMINYHMAVDSKLDVDTVSLGYGVRWNYWGMGYNTHTTAREYEVGTLVIDVIDAKTKQLVWRGAKEGRLREKQTPEERTLAVNSAVFDILANYPPKQQ